MMAGSFGDMARALAAGGGDGGGSTEGPGPDMESQDPNAPEEGPEMGGGDPAEVCEAAMQAALQAIEEFPGDLAEKARKHVEAILELCAQAEAAAGQGGQGDQGAEPAPDGQSDQVESSSPQGTPSVGGSPVSYGA